MSRKIRVTPGRGGVRDHRNIALVPVRLLLLLYLFVRHQGLPDEHLYEDRQGTLQRGP